MVGDGASQIPFTSRHPPSVTGATSLTSSQPLSTQGVGSSLSGYVPILYGQKAEDLYSDQFPVDTRQFDETSSAYLGRDLANETTARYADSSVFGRQTDLYDQASLLRGEQLLIQSLHTSAVDGGLRQADYLTERSSALRHSDQEAMLYGRRLGPVTHGLSVQNTSSYTSQHTPCAAPRQNLDDYNYLESSSNPGYGVSLPPGRDYGTGEGIPSAASLDFRREKESLVQARGGGGPSPRVYDLRKDGRASYLREFELREEERCRENMHARYMERERERERERQRAKYRKRIPTARPTSRDPKERTPVPKTARGSSLRLDSQHREASVRRHSPIRPIRRDYVCKVLSSRLVDMERDYLALDKRYPRLFVPSEFSKVIVNWPKQKLTLSLHTSVSFEHDYTHEDGGVDVRYTPTKSLAVKTRGKTVWNAKDGSFEHDYTHEDGGVDVRYTPTKSLAVKTRGKTVWNAKMILMSGLSRTARDDLASDKPFEDRVPHMCNILKFAVLKKNHSFMATGGPWDSTDGVNPSVDQSSLIKTMLRHTNDKLHLDLSNCRHWSPFLEIHYDRVGTDGVSGFKEITVLFVPDLSECLPSFDAWRTQWLAHKKALAERDRLLSQEVKKDVSVGKGSNDADAEKKTSGDLIKKTDKKNNSEIHSEGKKVDEKKAEEKINEKERSGKDESRIQVKSEEPPRPGFILQLKRNKDSKDIDESSFEVSLFAESLFEMLQSQMGTRILEFLKKLRLKFVRQRNQRKRHQEELSAKQKEAKTQNKRQKTVEHNDKETPAITESVPEKDDKETSTKDTVANNEDTLGNGKTTGDEAATMEVDNQDDELDEDPEEKDPEECEEMDPEEEPQKKEENNEKPSEEKGSVVEKTDSKSTEIKPKSESDKNGKQEEGTSDAPKREETVDKELLQIEDMRITIHILGKFTSHREVKELVQSALLESNTGRDDRILYDKLVRMSL